MRNFPAPNCKETENRLAQRTNTGNGKEKLVIIVINSGKLKQHEKGENNEARKRETDNIIHLKESIFILFGLIHLKSRQSQSQP